MERIHWISFLMFALSALVFGQIDWTKGTSGTSKSLYGVIYANGLYVAVGDGFSSNSATIFTSPDGITWTNRNNSGAKTVFLTDVTFGNGQFVAVGDGSSYNSASVFTSPNGTSWTNRSPSIPYSLFGVTYGNGLFVAVGSKTILTSPDGITWDSTHIEDGNSFYGVTYGNGSFVVVGGTNGIIYTSPDGDTWTKRSSGTTATLRSVIYGNNLYVAVGGVSAPILISPNGIEWTIVHNPLSYINYFTSVTYGNNQYVAVGSNGKIFTSVDGLLWVDRSLSTTVALNDVSYGNGLYVAVGVTGAIYTSVAISSLHTPVTKHNTKSVIGKTFRIYSIQGKLISHSNIMDMNFLNSKSSIYTKLSKGFYILRIHGTEMAEPIMVE